MSAQIITVGDVGDHGAVVITGSPTSKIRGRAIARLGDLVKCPGHYPDGRPHGINRIVRVSGTAKVGGSIMASWASTASSTRATGIQWARSASPGSSPTTWPSGNAATRNLVS